MQFFDTGTPHSDCRQKSTATGMLPPRLGQNLPPSLTRKAKMRLFQQEMHPDAHIFILLEQCPCFVYNILLFFDGIIDLSGCRLPFSGYAKDLAVKTKDFSGCDWRHLERKKQKTRNIPINIWVEQRASKQMDVFHTLLN